jgi:hypothetical protein
VVSEARRRGARFVAPNGRVRRARRQLDRPASVQSGSRGARGAAERASVHAAVRPDRASREGARRSTGDGRALDDRVRGRASALGRDLHLRDLRAGRCRGSRRRRDGRPSVRRPADRRRLLTGDGRARRTRLPRVRRGVDAGRRDLLRRRQSTQTRRPVARVSDAADARDLRASGTGRGRAADVLSESIRRRLRPRLPPQRATTAGRRSRSSGTGRERPQYCQACRRSEFGRSRSPTISRS